MQQFYANAIPCRTPPVARAVFHYRRDELAMNDAQLWHGIKRKELLHYTGPVHPSAGTHHMEQTAAGVLKSRQLVLVCDLLVNLDVRHEGCSEGKRLERGGKGFEPSPPQIANRHFYSSNFMRRTCTNWCFCLSLKFRCKNTIFGLHRSMKHCITACLVHRAKSLAAFYTPVTCEVESLLHIGNALSCIVALLLSQFGFFGSFSALNCGFSHSNSGVRLLPTTLFFDT